MVEKMIKIICIGKLKEKYLVDGINEYLKRLSRFIKVEIIELKEYPSFDESQSSIDKTKVEEGKEILSKISNEYVIALDPNGLMLDSIEFSKKLESIYINSSDITFIIGGSYGLSSSVKDRANYLMSFSKLTFPHQLFRLILLEQIFRAYKIMRNETYNK